MAKLKHIALLKFKEGTTSEQIDNLFNEILNFTEEIPTIEDYVAGPNCSQEGFSQGYTHGFVMTFHDTAARDAYLANPGHERIKALILSLIESAVVFDFEV